MMLTAANANSPQKVSSNEAFAIQNYDVLKKIVIEM